MTLLLFVVFVFVLFLQAQTENGYEVNMVVNEGLVSGSVALHPDKVDTIPDLWKWMKQVLVPAVNLQTPLCGKSSGNVCIGRSNFILSNQIILVQKRTELSSMFICDESNAL